MDDRDVGRWVRVVYWEKVSLGDIYPKKEYLVLTEICGNLRATCESYVTIAIKLSMYRENEVKVSRAAVIKYAWCEVLKWYD